jgi:hypothetical protein
VKFGSLGLVKIEITKLFLFQDWEEESQRNFFEKLVKNNSRTCGWNVEQVFTEIKAYGHEDPRKKLTGNCTYWWWRKVAHKQLVEYITGMDKEWISKRAFSRRFWRRIL